MKKLLPFTFRGLLLSLGFSLVSFSSMVSNANAASLTWDGDATYNGSFGGSGTWNTTTANWSNATADQAWTTNTTAGDTAVFAGTAGTVSLGTNINAAGLVFTTPGYTIESGTLSLGASGINASALASGTTTITSSIVFGGAQTWNVGTGATLSASGGITGANFSLVKSGAGALLLGGGGSMTGNLEAQNGSVSIASGTFSTGAFSFAGHVASQTGVVNVASGAALNWNNVNGGGLGFANNSSGVIYNSGAFSATQFYMANDVGTNASYGYFRNAGTMTIGNTLAIARTNNASLLDIVGGAATITPTADNQLAFAAGAGSVAGMNITGGGTFTMGAGRQVSINQGAGAYTSINISGTGSRFVVPSGGGINLMRTNNASNFTTLSLANGGELDAQYMFNNFASGFGACVLSFNGGVLKASASDGNGLLINNTAVLVESGGGTIDSGAAGVNAKINVPLLAVSGSGITNISLGGTLTGYVGAPIVKITGGGGQGAAAIANFDPATGTITGITITSPGTGYTSTPTVTLVGGNGGSTGSGAGTATATVTVDAIATGGMTFQGNGSVTLSATNTYTGATTISSGTLILLNAGQLGAGTNGGTAITNNATFIESGTAGIGFITGSSSFTNSAGTATLAGANNYTGPTSVNGGSLTFSGTSSIGSVSVGNATLGVKTSAPDSSVVTATGLTLASTGTSTLAFDFNSLANPTVPVINLSSNALVLNGTVNISLANFGGLDDATDSLALIGFGDQMGAGAFNLITTTSGHTGFSLNHTPTALYLNISAAINLWTGAASATWDIGTAGGATGTHNWGLSDQVYLEGDKVVFDDSASQFDVNLATTVNPGSVIFSNSSAHPYKLSGSGISGASPLILSGIDGTVILTNSNSYTGSTIIGASNTLQIGDGTTDGAISANSAIVNNGVLAFNTVGSVTSDSVISGIGSLVKTGPGSLAISAANSYSGGSSLNAGTLILNNNAALGSGTLAINGGTLDSTVAGINVGAAQRWNGNFVFAGSQSLTLSGAVALDAASTVTVNANTLTLSGPISGSSALGKSGNGTLTLSAANSYSGGTVLNGGVLVAANNTALGTGALTLAGGTLSASYTKNNRTLANAINVQANTTSFVSAPSGGDFYLNGNITGSGTVSFSGVYNGAGMRLDGDNSAFAGTAIIGGPNVRIDTANSASAGAAWVVNSGLQLSATGANTFNLGSLSGNGNITGHAAQTSLQTQTLSVGALNAADIFGGTITDNAVNDANYGNKDTAANNVLALTKVGTGSLTLPGANTYSGGTTVESGTLSVENFSGSATGTGAVTVASGASLNGGGSVGGNVIVSGELSGSVGIGGDLTLNATSSMNGSHILKGNVVLNGGIAANLASDIDLAAGKTLSGTGGTIGNVNATAAGSIVAPGNSGVGHLSLGSLTTTSGAHLSMDILSTTAGGYDTITVGNSITLTGGDLTLNLGSFTPGGETLFLLINSLDGAAGNSGTSGNFDSITFAGLGTGSLLSGTGEEGTEMSINGATYTLTYLANFEGYSLGDGNDIALIAAVPEPSTWAMLVAGVGMLVSFQRSRRRH